jgi:sigma-B regulation protein RsbU (phosphoserine phosphatase)
VKPVEIDPDAVVAETVEELLLASPGRAIEHRKVGEGLGFADPDRVAQVVTNLVGNAIAYGTSGEPVTITSEVGDATLAIRVTTTASQSRRASRC